VEFFSDSIQHPEPALIEMMTTLSAQIGQLLTLLEERRTLVRRLRDADARGRPHGARQPPGVQ
jgi:hypothetical protein